VQIRLRYITPTLAAGAAAVAIAAAPSAMAANQQSCVDLGGATQCQTPGNVQINSDTPAANAGGYSSYGPFFTYDRGRGGSR
jgi:hypothetical protein